MDSHEEYLELSAAATAGELNPEEKKRLEEHLRFCPSCQRAANEYETALGQSLPHLAYDSELRCEDADSTWSTQEAERAFFQRLEDEESPGVSRRVKPNESGQASAIGRFTYRSSRIHWREIWLPFAATVVLALALGIAAYRAGIRHGGDVARTPPPTKDSFHLHAEQFSDASHERAGVVAKLAERDKAISDLKRQLSELLKKFNTLRGSSENIAQSGSGTQGPNLADNDEAGKRKAELEAAQTKILDLQRTIEDLTAHRQGMADRASPLEEKVAELTQLVRDGEQALDEKQAQVARLQELLEHDRDIRELVGARDLYIAEVHDVSRIGTDKTYGRVFYAKGKSLIFYAYDLDTQPWSQITSSFQAWGRRGPDKKQARNLGIFYEDNATKKRWVLRAEDPKTLEDIDAVFVTVEPNGGSHHPSGRQLLFAYLQVRPNHP